MYEGNLTFEEALELNRRDLVLYSPPDGTHGLDSKMKKLIPGKKYEVIDTKLTHNPFNNPDIPLNHVLIQTKEGIFSCRYFRKA